MLGTRSLRWCTSRSRVDSAATRWTSRTLSTALGHSRSNEHAHKLDLSKMNAEKQGEKEKEERGVEEHVVNSTGPAPSARSPGRHGARLGLCLLGLSSGG